MSVIPPLEVVIGTKAQYIKTAPVLRELDRRGLRYRLIDTGQHAAMAPELRKSLGLNEPDAVLANEGNVATIGHALAWSARLILMILRGGRRVRQEIFDPRSEWCLIHGDTPTTLLSLLLAKRAGKKVAHLEAGLRSFNLFRPFPEELVRIICMRFSDLLFAPSDFAMGHIERMGLGDKAIKLTQNTNVEALTFSLSQSSEQKLPQEPFALVTTHRVETIFDKARLRFVLDAVFKVAEDLDVVFVMHDPTERRLNAYDWLEELRVHPRIKIQRLVKHPDFLRLLSACEFVMTDGGSIQEEAFFLDKPCLVMRSETERDEGLGANVRLASFDAETLRQFLHDWPSMKRGRLEADLRPSVQIVDELLSRSEGGVRCPK